jgi:hypothetical protein
MCEQNRCSHTVLDDFEIFTNNHWSTTNQLIDTTANHWQQHSLQRQHYAVPQTIGQQQPKQQSTINNNNKMLRIIRKLMFCQRSSIRKAY